MDSDTINRLGKNNNNNSIDDDDAAQQQKQQQDDASRQAPPQSDLPQQQKLSSGREEDAITVTATDQLSSSSIIIHHHHQQSNTSPSERINDDPLPRLSASDGAQTTAAVPTVVAPPTFSNSKIAESSDSVVQKTAEGNTTSVRNDHQHNSGSTTRTVTVPAGNTVDGADNHNIDAPPSPAADNSSETPFVTSSDKVKNALLLQREIAERGVLAVMSGTYHLSVIAEVICENFLDIIETENGCNVVNFVLCKGFLERLIPQESTEKLAGQIARNLPSMVHHPWKHSVPERCCIHPIIVKAIRELLYADVTAGPKDFSARWNHSKASRIFDQYSVTEDLDNLCLVFEAILKMTAGVMLQHFTNHSLQRAGERLRDAQPTHPRFPVVQALLAGHLARCSSTVHRNVYQAWSLEKPPAIGGGGMPSHQQQPQRQHPIQPQQLALQQISSSQVQQQQQLAPPPSSTTTIHHYYHQGAAQTPQVHIPYSPAAASSSSYQPQLYATANMASPPPLTQVHHYYPAQSTAGVSTPVVTPSTISTHQQPHHSYYAQQQIVSSSNAPAPPQAGGIHLHQIAPTSQTPSFLSPVQHQQPLLIQQVSAPPPGHQQLLPPSVLPAASTQQHQQLTPTTSTTTSHGGTFFTAPQSSQQPLHHNVTTYYDPRYEGK